MKIWTWTDRCFLSDESRRKTTLDLTVWVFWGWQCIWIGVLFWQMTGADSYDGLFSLQSVLDEWNGSFLVRLLFQEIQGTLQPASALDAADWAGIVLTVLKVSAGSSRTEKIWGGVFAGLIVFACIMALSCLSVSTLMEAAWRLRVTGMAGSAVILLLLTGCVYFISRDSLSLGLK